MTSRREEADQTFGLRRPAPIFPVRDLEMALEFYVRLGFRVSRYDEGHAYATREGCGCIDARVPSVTRLRTIRLYTSTPPRSTLCTGSGSDPDCRRYRPPAERRFMTRRGDVGTPESPSVASATSSRTSRGVSASSRSWISTTTNCASAGRQPEAASGPRGPAGECHHAARPGVLAYARAG
jgi:hypothetical protein